MTSSQFSNHEVPHFAGFLTGIRAMELYPSGELYSPQRHFLWHPGENVAQCSMSRSNLFDPNPWERLGRTNVASRECYCGFYAYFDPQWADSYMPFIDGVYCIVKAYGRITYGTHGFRSEKAEIIALAPRYPLNTPEEEPTEPVAPMYSYRAWPWIVALLVIVLIPPAFVPVTPWALLGWIAVPLGIWAYERSLDRSRNRWNKKLDEYIKQHREWAIERQQNAMSYGYPELKEKWLEKMFQRYPDVKWYSSLEEMVKAHPLSSADQISVGD